MVRPTAAGPANAVISARQTAAVPRVQMVDPKPFPVRLLPFSWRAIGHHGVQGQTKRVRLRILISGSTTGVWRGRRRNQDWSRKGEIKVAAVARKLRLEFPGACYHVINRGNYRGDIFRTEGARAAFEACLFEACLKSECLLHAFTLMRNHFHLALETPRATIRRGGKICNLHLTMSKAAVPLGTFCFRCPAPSAISMGAPAIQPQAPGAGSRQARRKPQSMSPGKSGRSIIPITLERTVPSPAFNHVPARGSNHSAR